MECAGQRSHWPGAAPKPDKKLASIRNLVGARSKYAPPGRHSHRHPRSSQSGLKKCVPWTILYHLSLDKRFYLGQSFHNKTTIVRQIFLTQLERISDKMKKEKLSQPWSEQLCPDRSSGAWARPRLGPADSTAGVTLAFVWKLRL